MSNIETGGPAFPSGMIDPVTPEDALHPLHSGMTLRDYFAAKAVSSLTLSYYAGPNGTSCRPVAKDVAEYAYEMADAMLKARGQS